MRPEHASNGLVPRKRDYDDDDKPRRLKPHHNKC